MISKPLVKLDNQVFGHVMYPNAHPGEKYTHSVNHQRKKVLFNEFCSSWSQILIMINNYARVAMISKLHGARYATSEAGESRESEFFVLHTLFLLLPLSTSFLPLCGSGFYTNIAVNVAIL